MQTSQIVCAVVAGALGLGAISPGMGFPERLITILVAFGLVVFACTRKKEGAAE